VLIAWQLYARRHEALDAAAGTDRAQQKCGAPTHPNSGARGGARRDFPSSIKTEYFKMIEAQKIGIALTMTSTIMPAF
jgi:hypothetical protein